jgi:hypothetical protein
MATILVAGREAKSGVGVNPMCSIRQMIVVDKKMAVD